MRKIVTGRRLAIRLPDGTRLAVPPMSPNTPPKTRQLVFEYVLRRQPGLAEITAQIAADASSGADARDRLASMMGEQPYKASLMDKAAA